MKLGKILTLVLTLPIASISAVEGDGFENDHPVRKTHFTIKKCNLIIDELQKKDKFARQDLESVFRILSDIGKIDFKNMPIELLIEFSDHVKAYEVINIIPVLCNKISLLSSKDCEDVKQKGVILCKDLARIQLDILCKKKEATEAFASKTAGIIFQREEKTFVAKKESGGFWNFLFGNSKNGYEALEPN
jgi:hypothetical protein